MKIKILLIILFWIIPFGIHKVYSQTKKINYYNWNKNCKFKTRPSTFIIDNVNQFNEISDCTAPKFDFANHTIIGVQGTSPGHFQPKVDIIVYQNDTNKKIIIEVTLSGGKLCEACRVNKPFYRRVIYTDKLNSDYGIEFNYIKIDR